MSGPQPRISAGVPEGGRFSVSQKSESAVTLGAVEPQSQPVEHEPLASYDVPEDAHGMDEMAFELRTRVAYEALQHAKLPFGGRIDDSGVLVITHIDGTFATGYWKGSRGRRREFSASLGDRKFLRFDSQNDAYERAHDSALESLNVAVASVLDGRAATLDTIAKDLKTAAHYQRHQRSFQSIKAQNGPNSVTDHLEGARERARTALLRLAVEDETDPKAAEAMNVMVGLGFPGSASELQEMGANYSARDAGLLPDD